MKQTPRRTRSVVEFFSQAICCVYFQNYEDNSIFGLLTKIPWDPKQNITVKTSPVSPAAAILMSVMRAKWLNKSHRKCSVHCPCEGWFPGWEVYWGCSLDRYKWKGGKQVQEEGSCRGVVTSAVEHPQVSVKC